MLAESACKRWEEQVVVWLHHRMLQACGSGGGVRLTHKDWLEYVVKLENTILVARRQKHVGHSTLSYNRSYQNVICILAKPDVCCRPASSVLAL